MLTNAAVVAVLAALLVTSGVLGYRLYARSRPGEKPPEAELTPLREAAARIKPLHSAKKPPQPGDWLLSHHEDGQTFDEYLISRPNRPTAELTTLYVQPLGDFTPAQSKLIDDTADGMGWFFGLPVKRLQPLGLDVIPAEARRTHPQWGDKQILTTYVRDLLAKRRPRDAVATIALTTADLWPGQGWNFVFGEASLTERVGVWSLYRYGDPEKDYPLVLRRTLQTAFHETGHMLGIQHCTAYECGMNGSNDLEESDRAPLAFCPECEQKIWWACHADPKRRYDALAEFAEKHGLKEAAKLWKDSAEAVGKGG
jgi:archaemetzincin